MANGNPREPRSPGSRVSQHMTSRTINSSNITVITTATITKMARISPSGRNSPTSNNTSRGSRLSRQPNHTWPLQHPWLPPLLNRRWPLKSRHPVWAHYPPTLSAQYR